MKDYNYGGINNPDGLGDSEEIKKMTELEKENLQNTSNDINASDSGKSDDILDMDGAPGDTDKGEEGNPNLSSSPFYSESCKAPKKGKGVLLQMIVVALMSSIIGGGLVGGFFMFGIPTLKTPVQSILGKPIDEQNELQDTAKSMTDASMYKKVVIENSDSAVVSIAEKVGPSVVGISVKFTPSNDFWFFSQSEAEEQGSGIIIRSDGYIMTNNHVIESALSGSSNNLLQGAKIQVILPSNPDKPYDATVVGRDPRTDLAVLKIEVSSLPAIEYGDSDQVKVGELAVAIGNPGGLEYMGSVTVGVISGLNRTIPITDDKELKLIQTDASINPGNSGGALVDKEGKLIGVNTAKIGGGGFEGLGFAIPVNKVKEITDNLIEYKYVRGRPALGVQINVGFTKTEAERFGLPEGVLVYKVEIFSAAYKADIQKDDIITEFNGVRIKTFDELEEQKNKYKPGDEVKLKIYRYEQQGKGKELTLDIVLDEKK